MLCWSAITLAAPAKLVIVIDDFGYRLKNELAMIALSPNITVSVLPDAPHAERVATAAEQNGNDVMLHLPMLPLSRQPLEINTLTPVMTEQQVKAIIDRALMKVPFAVGINNHMGSAMTSNYPAMQRVMEAISAYPFFFLDSKTVARSQVKKAGKDFRKTVLERDVFLDDTIETGAIRQQFQRAIAVARKQGQAIVIGHPHTQTLHVLQQMLKNLPQDIQLVKITDLLPPLASQFEADDNEPDSTTPDSLLPEAKNKENELNNRQNNQ